jgi:N-terminal domain of toast_rack, DUF2154/LiaF transmembrane domain
MAQTGPQMRYPRHRSFVGPILLIVLGVLFLLLNLYPGFDPWPVIWRYWPLILIFIGLGKIWDSYYAREHSTAPWVSGTGIAWIILIAFFFLAFWHGGRRWHDRAWDDSPFWHQRYMRDAKHDTQTIDLGAAKSVTADIQMPAGNLNLSGGSAHLFDADFEYDSFEGKPEVNYEVSGEQGHLNVTQGGRHVHFGGGDNYWNVHFGGSAPIDLRLNMGAGQNHVSLAGLNVSHLDIHMGVGELRLDLTGMAKTGMQGYIEGGVGSATIRLPKDEGVRVIASGGIGSVHADGLKNNGDGYVNDAYGKTAQTIELTVHGGVGQINLEEE